MIYNGDCIKGMKELKDCSVDLVVTDPPYLMNYHTSHRKNKDHKFCHAIANDKNKTFVHEYLRECYRVLKDNTAAYVFCNQNHIDFFLTEAREAGFNVKNIIVWVKNCWTAGDLTAAFGKQYEFILLLNKGRKPINGKRITDVWHFDRVSYHHSVHANQKPIELIKQCIEKHSNVGELVLDGCMGSGTTGVAAKELNRKFIGWEIDKEYFEVAKQRIKEE